MSFNHSRVSNIARGFATLIVLALFSVGSLPVTGSSFQGPSHVFIHALTFALIAISIGLGWPRLSTIQLFVLAALIGALDETSEIFTHHHPLETNDILIDAGGALIGTLLQHFIYRWLVRKEHKTTI